MTVGELIERLKDVDPNWRVDIVYRSDYPNSINTERILIDGCNQKVLIEADD